MTIDAIYNENELYKIIIWGAGIAGRDVFQTIMQCYPNIEIKAIVDSEKKYIIGMEYLGDIVQPVTTIKNEEYDYIVMATSTRAFEEQMMNYLSSIGIDNNKILRYEPIAPSKLIFLWAQKDIFVREFFLDIINSFVNDEEEQLTRTRKNVEILSNRIKNLQYHENSREWYVSKNGKCVYLNIPKSAGTSIIKCICELEESTGVQAIAKEKNYRYSYKLPDNMNCYKFTFVRNPFIRLLSCYKNKIEGREKTYFYENANYFALKGISEDLGFDSFVETVSKIPDKWSDIHFKSQCNYIFDEEKKAVVDYYGRVENIYKDFEVIRKEYMLPELGHQNQSEYYDLDDYYTEELVEKVYERYKDDVELLGYHDDYIRLLERYKQK
jgi:hypothetical protein